MSTPRPVLSSSVVCVVVDVWSLKLNVLVRKLATTAVAATAVTC